MSVKLKIITPDGIFINDEEVDIVNIQSIDGDMGIMGKMIPMVTALKIGTLSYRKKNKQTFIHVHRGIVTVDSKQCKVITERLYLVDKNGNKINGTQKYS